MSGGERRGSCAVGVFSWTIDYWKAPTPSLRVVRPVLAGGTLRGYRHGDRIAIKMVAATLAWSRHPKASACTATAAVISVVISCTDQVASQTVRA